MCTPDVCSSCITELTITRLPLASCRFWQAAESFDEEQKRALLQFWSGCDGVPPGGFGAVEPPFHIVAVDRMYDSKDRTARLPAAHTCFRQLDLPRYRSAEEAREKLLIAITTGSGYMALS